MKSFFHSLVIMMLALIFVPSRVTSSPVNAMEYIASRMAIEPFNALFAPESPKSAAARVVAAKKRAGTKAKRALQKASRVQERSQKEYRVSQADIFSRYINTRCSADRRCANSNPARDLTGSHRTFVCNIDVRRCTVVCYVDFVEPDPITGVCTASTKNPPAPANGFYQRVGSPATCVLICDSSHGYVKVGTGTSQRCVNIQVDPLNCGALGQVSPASYNGNGSPVCRGGVCGLVCIEGHRRFTASGKAYCTR